MFDRRSVIVGLTVATMARSGRAAAALPVTPQEMLGPFYPAHPLPDHDLDLTRIRGHSGQARGEIIEIVGRVLQPNGRPVQHAAIEVWQANAAGKYRHPDDMNPAPLDPDFQGFARLASGADGGFRILTVKPGSYPAPIGIRTPHVHFEIRSREFTLATQIYFSGEPLNAADPLLASMPARRLNPALVMAHEPDRGGRSDFAGMPS